MIKRHLCLVEKLDVGAFFSCSTSGAKHLRMPNRKAIEYVMDCMKGNTSKVCNIKKYLLAALFNAPTTIGGFYQAAVNFDMPQLAMK